MSSNYFQSSFFLRRLRTEVSRFLTRTLPLGVRISLIVMILLGNETQVKAQDDYLSYGKDFSVTYSTEVPVSGGVLAGIFRGNLSQRVNPDSLRVYLPSEDWPRLCLEIITQEGQYRAWVPDYYLVSARANDYPLLKLPPKDSDKLADYYAGEVGVLARIGDSCSSPAQRFIPIRWSRASDEDPIVILLNTRASHVRLEVRAGGQQQASFLECPEISNQAPSKPSIAFNRRCVITALPPEPVVEIVIHLRRGIDSRSIPLHLLHKVK